MIKIDEHRELRTEVLHTQCFLRTFPLYWMEESVLLGLAKIAAEVLIL